jgi:16S rRNA (cytidine1402-2'-O)-methyltransferase
MSNSTSLPHSPYSPHSDSLAGLWVIATPIGNLRDITLRALDVLSSVKWLAAEDTRRSRQLLEHYNLSGPRLLSLHEHNEVRRIPRLLRLLESGEGVGLVCDAGTPLLSDPGARLVASAHDKGVRVVAVPGPSSITAALAIAGFEADPFDFEGFLPAKQGARRKVLAEVAERGRTCVFF